MSTENYCGQIETLTHKKLNAIKMFDMLLTITVFELHCYTYSHTEQNKKTIICMFHTHIIWQDIRRGKGHVCVRR